MARQAMAVAIGADRLVIHASRLLSAIESDLSEQSLAFKHASLLYGGWERPDGAWITQPHKILLRFHEARKACFCPVCKKCLKPSNQCQCGQAQDLCWHHLGQAPKDEDTTFDCPIHSKLGGIGSIPWRRAQTYSTVALVPANKVQKTTGMLAELVATMLGRRPWDDSLTAPPGSNRLFMVVCQVLQTSSQMTIEPIMEEYLRGRYKAVKNTSHGLSYYSVKTPFGTDKCKIVSHDQHARSASSASPFEGVNPYELAWDEPMTGDMRGSLSRGLLPARTAGWGREMIAATPIDTQSPQAAAYLFNEVYKKAWNQGGRERSIFALGGSIYETPVLSSEALRQIIDSWPIYEREARSTGIYKTLRGRILSEFDPKLHVWNDAERDVLIDPITKEPSDWPLAIGVDPHDVRPWVFVVVALSPQGHWYVVREWPDGDFQKMRHYRAAGVDGSFEGYANVIQGLIDSVPGGRPRFRWWVMDPAFGDSEKAGGQGTVVNRMRQQGFFFRTDIPRDLEPGHQFLRGMMRGSLDMEAYMLGKAVIDEMHRPHYYVAERCRNVIWSNLNYVNDEGNDPAKFREKPAEAGKDFIDPQRYISMLKPAYGSWKHSAGWYNQQSQDLLRRMTSARR